MTTETRWVVYLFPSILWLLQFFVSVSLRNPSASGFIGVTAVSAALTTLLRVSLHSITNFNAPRPKTSKAWRKVRRLARALLLVALVWWFWTMISNLDTGRTLSSTQLYRTIFLIRMTNDGYASDALYFPLYTVVSLLFYVLAVRLSEMRETCGS
jgi:hypothetical protein